LVGQKKAIAIAVRNISGRRRWSKLGEWLRSGSHERPRTSKMRFIKRGAHKSVKDLIAAIMAFLARQNADPKPLRWTKSADDILASIERFCRRTLDLNAKAG
jgi:hypothetical protein